MENSNQNKFSKLEIFLAIAVIVLITIVAYGLLMKSFGYYSDEWYVAWAGRTSGPGLIVQMHQFDLSWDTFMLFFIVSWVTTL